MSTGGRINRYQWQGIPHHFPGTLHLGPTRLTCSVFESDKRLVGLSWFNAEANRRMTHLSAGGEHSYNELVFACSWLRVERKTEGDGIVVQVHRRALYIVTLVHRCECLWIGRLPQMRHMLTLWPTAQCHWWPP